MDFHMTEEQGMITGAVRRFVREEVAPLERDLDPDAVELPPGELDRLKEIVRGMGLYHIDVPEDHGGPGLPLTTRGLVAEEMSQASGGAVSAVLRGVWVGGAGAAVFGRARSRRSGICIRCCGARSGRSLG